MQELRAAFAADQKAIHAKRLTDAQYDALAAKVNDRVAYIVANCKLDKDADAQLHVVIGEMLAAAEAMQGKTRGEARREGAERLAKALNAYGRYFDHPGWKRLHV